MADCGRRGQMSFVPPNRSFSHQAGRTADSRQKRLPHRLLCHSGSDGLRVRLGRTRKASTTLRPYCDTARNYHAYTRSEEHTSKLQSLMRISYAVFCLKKKK